MKVYITYDRYGSDEWFQVIQVTDKLSEVKKDYKKKGKEMISMIEKTHPLSLRLMI